MPCCTKGALLKLICYNVVCVFMPLNCFLPFEICECFQGAERVLKEASKLHYGKCLLRILHYFQSETQSNWVVFQYCGGNVASDIWIERPNGRKWESRICSDLMFLLWSSSSLSHSKLWVLAIQREHQDTHRGSVLIDTVHLTVQCVQGAEQKPAWCAFVYISFFLGI